MFDFAKAKASLHQTVHTVLGVGAHFKYNSSSVGIPIKARPHSRLVQQGQIENVGAEVIEGIEQVVFNSPELREIGIVPARGNIVSFDHVPGYELMLDFRLPTQSAIEEIWAVIRV